MAGFRPLSCLIRERPGLFIWWLFLWLLEMAGVGCLAAVLVFGWLDQGFSWLTWLSGGLTALTVGTLRLRQRNLSLRGETRLARRLSKSLVWPVLATLVLLFGLSLGQLHANGMVGWFSSRADALNRLLRALERNYPYFAAKAVDWQTLKADYLPKLQAAGSNQEFMAIMGEFLAHFQDVHTQVLYPSPLADWQGLMAVRQIEGQAVVTAVRPDLDLPGLGAGAVILCRNGLSVSEFVARLPLSAQTSSTPWAAKSKQMSLLGAAPAGEDLLLTYIGTDGQTHSEHLVWEIKPAIDRAGQLVRSERLESGVGVIRIDRLTGGKELVAQFDQALDSMLDAPGIILDLRHNGGGNSVLGDDIAGRFLAKRFRYGQEYYRQRLPWRAWAKRMTYQVTPRGKVYAGPLVVLTSADTVSSAEMLTVALRDSGRAVLVGQTTAGGSGNPCTFEIAGGLVRFSTGDFRRNDGSSIEGIGITPDIVVEWTVDDVLDGIDPDLEAAHKVILQSVRD